jgi:hypothetical protein
MTTRSFRTRIAAGPASMATSTATTRHYPQLYSRLGFSHRYRALGREELLFVLDRHCKRRQITRSGRLH